MSDAAQRGPSRTVAQPGADRRSSAPLAWWFAAAGVLVGTAVGLLTGLVWALLSTPASSPDLSGALLTVAGFTALAGCVVGGLTGAVVAFWASGPHGVRRPPLVLALLVGVALTAAACLLLLGPGAFPTVYAVALAPCLLGVLLLRPVADRLAPG